MTQRENIELGNRVSDVVTGFEGIATERLDTLGGVVQYAVQPENHKNSEYPKSYYIPAARLKRIDNGIHVEKVRKILGFHSNDGRGEK